MNKRHVTYRCESCGHEDYILEYVEGEGLDRVSYQSNDCDRTNRSRHDAMRRSECESCGKVGFERVG